MKEIALNKGYVTLVDDSDYERVSAFKWHVIFNSHSGKPYVARWVSRHQRQAMHRFILGLSDPLVQVDHRDNDGLNNQRDNLRPCNGSQNRGNISKPRAGSTSKYKGVSKKSRWGNFVAQIASNYIGSFLTEEEAALAYDAAAIERYGEFAKLNFPIRERSRG